MNRLYYITMYRGKQSDGAYIEAKNLFEALKDFNVLYPCEGYESLIIRRIYRQIQMRHTIEQIARKNKQKINQLKQVGK